MTGASPSSGRLIRLQIGHHQFILGSIPTIMTGPVKVHACWDGAWEIVN